jgi:drug/metabolite transporter (DMT)-like permease
VFLLQSGFDFNIFWTDNLRVTKKRLHSYILMSITTLTWGAFLPIVKWGFNESDITAFRYLLYRFALAGMLSLPIIFYYWPKIKQKGAKLRTIVGMEILETCLALGFLYAGLARSSALETNLIATTLPLFVILGGVIFLKEKLKHQERWGLLLALSGTLLLVSEPLWRENTQAQVSWLGNLFVIMHNLLTAAYLLLAKKHYKNIPKLFVTSISFWVGLVFFAALSLFEFNWQLQPWWQQVFLELQSVQILLVIGYAAIFGSIIGLTTYIKGQDGIEASEASLFTYLQPAVYIPLGYFLLQEPIAIWQIFALIIIIYGVYQASKR